MRQGLLEGKVYPQERVQRAMNNFFTEDNLSLLRELALRETARDVAGAEGAVTRSRLWSP